MLIRIMSVLIVVLFVYLFVFVAPTLKTDFVHERVFWEVIQEHEKPGTLLRVLKPEPADIEDNNFSHLYLEWVLGVDLAVYQGDKQLFQWYLAGCGLW